MTSRIEIIDTALICIGATPLMTETARGADRRVREYRTLLTGLLTMYPWWFATRTRQLTRLTATAPLHWSFRYGLPADMLGAPRAAYDSASITAPFHDWELRPADTDAAPGELVTNAKAVWLKYTVDVAPQFWPGYFHMLMVRALSAEFALSVREDSVLRDKLRRDIYGTPDQQGNTGLIGEAKQADAQSKPAQFLSLGSNPLIDVRF